MTAETPPLAALAEALRERCRVIADRESARRDPAAHLAALEAASGEIERRAEALPAPVNGELAHFLTRCSYDKALAWIEARL